MNHVSATIGTRAVDPRILADDKFLKRMGNFDRVCKQIDAKHDHVMEMLANIQEQLRNLEMKQRKERGAQFQIQSQMAAIKPPYLSVSRPQQIEVESRILPPNQRLSSSSYASNDAKLENEGCVEVLKHAPIISAVVVETVETDFSTTRAAKLHEHKVFDEIPESENSKISVIPPLVRGSEIAEVYDFRVSNLQCQTPHVSTQEIKIESDGLSLISNPSLFSSNSDGTKLEDGGSLKVPIRTTGTKLQPQELKSRIEVNNQSVNILPNVYPGQSHAHSIHSADDLPKNVVANLNQGSAVKSMDFHPVQQTLLLVGTNIGEISIWEVSNGERIVARNFKAWDLGACSIALQASLANEYTASVKRIAWSPEGNLFGVAYSKHIIHLYAYYGGDDIRNHLQIDAHNGSVNDLAFSHVNKQLCVITCGEDKTIKVWDPATGVRQYTFEGHEAPVYSVCPHQKENIQFLFSTSVDGKIKAWLYDNLGSRVDYEAPGRCCTTMAYTADGTRLFSGGTNKDGDSYIVEWNESEGAVKRTYVGLGKRSAGVVQFDTTKNRFLAAGDEFKIKFWDMDNVNVLMSIDAEGGLPASPSIRFSKEGALLAVATSENGIKILANAEGIRLMRYVKRAGATKAPVIGTFGASGSAGGSSVVADRSSPMRSVIKMNGDSRNLPDPKSRISNELDRSKMWKLTEIDEQSQLRSLRLSDSLLAVRIIRLIYTNSGSCILALAYNAVHKLWKWQRCERNASGKATTSVPPQLWQPSSGILMTNDITETNLEEAVPCFALSKNDSYVMSASGGKISLFNMMTFKTMTTFMPPPPAATFLAFHPQDNNVIAIGMEDSSIQIYNVRVDEVKIKLKGHQKRITGLAFSSVLNILVSSAADTQVCVWDLEGWEKKTNRFLHIPNGRSSNPNGHTRVQFHQDQIHMLIVHESQLAIYEASELDCVKQWVCRDSSTPAITDATYSCDSQSIFACFDDGSVFIFTAAGLRLRCRINPAAYMPHSPSSRVHPLVITGHPSEPNQFALGLSDGGVHVLEPLESEGNWGTAPPQQNGVGSSKSAVASASASAQDQSSR